MTLVGAISSVAGLFVLLGSEELSNSMFGVVMLHNESGLDLIPPPWYCVMDKKLNVSHA